MLWFALVAAGCVVRFQYVGLYRQKKRRELAASAAILCFALALFILRSLQIPLPDPLEWISAIYGPLSKVVSQALD